MYLSKTKVLFQFINTYDPSILSLHPNIKCRTIITIWTWHPLFPLFTPCLLVLCHEANAQFGTGGQSPWHTSRGFGDRKGCWFDHLDVLNPSQRVQSEAGMTEYYEESNEMLRCAGVSVKCYIMEPRGLLLPAYHNAPSLMYITQGRGLIGTIFPGCPETYQFFQQQAEMYTEGTMTKSQRQLRDEHQKVCCFQQGDIIALLPGVIYWCYNDGDISVVAIQVFDTSNSINQLEPAHRVCGYIQKKA